MPYLQSLIAKGGLATNYFANFHPSIGNYFELIIGDSAVAGQISQAGDDYTPPAGVSTSITSRAKSTPPQSWKMAVPHRIG
jgi:hypothetical protein